MSSRYCSSRYGKKPGWWDDGLQMYRVCKNLVAKTKEAEGICEQLSTNSQPVKTVYKYTKSGMKYQSTTWEGGGLPW